MAEQKYQIWVCKRCGAVRRIRRGLREDDRPMYVCKCGDYNWIPVNNMEGARRLIKDLEIWEWNGGYWSHRITKF